MTFWSKRRKKFNKYFTYKIIFFCFSHPLENLLFGDFSTFSKLKDQAEVFLGDMTIDYSDYSSYSLEPK